MPKEITQHCTQCGRKHDHVVEVYGLLCHSPNRVNRSGFCAWAIGPGDGRVNAVASHSSGLGLDGKANGQPRRQHRLDSVNWTEIHEGCTVLRTWVTCVTVYTPPLGRVVIALLPSEPPGADGCRLKEVMYASVPPS